MKKRPLIWGLVLLACLGLGISLFYWQKMPVRDNGVSEKEIAETIKRLGRGTEAPAQTTAAPLDLKRPVRLAIGNLGLTDDEQNRRLGDLVLAELTGAPGLNLVERQSLDAVLRELNMSLSGLVRANDAVRAGKLLKADWFLLGTEAKINGTNSIVIRVVDASTGILRDAGVFSGDKSSTQLAANIAAFVRQTRQNAASAKPRVYLAIGTFEDLSVNNRQAAFPAQLRSYLTTAYQGGEVTLLEREYVDALLQEVRLDLAGLTDTTNAPEPMQSAYWLVDGDYQSFETTNYEVEVVLNLNRIFGRWSEETFRGLPDARLFQKIKQAIDTRINQDTSTIVVSRVSEAHAQMSAGKKLADFANHPSRLVYADDYYLAVDARSHRNDEEAMRAFETVLLLEPTNREAKIDLASFFRNPALHRTDEARNFYRELLEEPVQDKWVAVAQQALVQSFRRSDPEEKSRWFSAAVQHNTNSAVDEFYRQNAGIASRDAAINSHEGNSTELAQKRLLERVRSCKNFMAGKGGKLYGDYGLFEFRDTFAEKAAAAQAMADFLPTLEKTYPELAPHLAAEVLWFQVDTNSPIVAEFEKTLDWCVAHPKEVFQPGHYWSESAGSAFQWLTWAQQYALAVKTMEAWRAAADQNVIEHFESEDQVALGFAYMGAERWQDALAVFESFTNKVVKPTRDGPWGKAYQPVLTDRIAVFCREKLRLAIAQDPRKFDLGKPVLCLGSPATFVADDNGLWVGVGGQLLHLDFDLRTNLSVTLPMDAGVPISAICRDSSKIWIGTQGAGLIEFDKTTGHCRHLTQADGLIMDYLSSLEVTGDTLWIGYGGATGGGLGKLDLISQKVNSFMPSLDPNQSVHTGEAPPRAAIGQIIAGADGDLWMWVASAVRQFHVARGVWETLPSASGNWVTCFSVDSQRLVKGGAVNLSEIEISTKPSSTVSTDGIKKTRLVVSFQEESRVRADLKTNGSNQYISLHSSGRIPSRGTLAIQNLRDRRWQNLEDADGLPNPPTTLTLDGDNLWVGGEGAIALVDLKQCKVRKFCHVKAASVDRIQIAGGYVWAQFDSHLYRVPLSSLQ